MSDNKVIIGTDNGAAWWRLFTKRIVWIPLLVIIVAIAASVVITTIKHHNDQMAANKAAQKSLESNLQRAISDANNAPGVVTLVNQLLDGKKQGKFTISNSETSTLYLNRASAYANMQQYKNAVSDYEQASKLDSTNKMAALQGEVEARYHLGDRKQLVPLYQQLIDLMGKSQDPMKNSFIAQYQQNIDALQNGQELQF